MMSMSKKIAIALVAGVLAAACHKKSDAPEDGAGPARATPTKVEAKEPAIAQPEVPVAADAVVERGHYLADLMGCQNCHTPFGAMGPDADLLWAGGLEVPETFGTWRSPNITQDKETGIGGWTDEQILAAIREGKRPNGDLLFPIMPYPMYHALSDEDGKALVKYLRTVPAKNHPVVRATELKLPRTPLPPPAGKAPDHADADAGIRRTRAGSQDRKGPAWARTSTPGSRSRSAAASAGTRPAP
jgi:mono/diheme cytochrome c family protein